MTEPVAMFPDSAPIEMWRTKHEPPVVTLRCTRGERRCDRVAYIYETDESAVVVFYRHSTDRPITAHTALLEQRDEFVGAESGGLKKWDGVTDSALMRGRLDERGTVVCLEQDDGWSNIVQVGCRSHIGLITLSRSQLMQYLREARQQGRSIDVGVS